MLSWRQTLSVAALLLICGSLRAQTCAAASPLFPNLHVHCLGTPDGVVIGDLNGDGILDAAAIAQKSPMADDDVYIALGTGGGHFAPSVGLGLDAHGLDLELADLDGDGVLDLIVAHSSGDEILVCLGQGDGGFGPAVVTPTTVQPCTALLADLNGDALPDLVVTAFPLSSAGFGFDPGRLEIRLGLGGGQFGPPTLHSIPSGGRGQRW